MSLNTYIQEINDQVKLLRQDVLDLALCLARRWCRAGARDC